MDFFDHMEKDKAEGFALAEGMRRQIDQQVFSHDRYQGGVPQRNMLRALEMLPWMNTVEDWQRYYETKIIIEARARRKRGGNIFSKPKKLTRNNPGSARLRAQRRGEIILFRGKVALVKGTRAEVNRYLATQSYANRDGLWELAI